MKIRNEAVSTSAPPVRKTPVTRAISTDRHEFIGLHQTDAHKRHMKRASNDSDLQMNLFTDTGVKTCMHIKYLMNQDLGEQKFVVESIIPVGDATLLSADGGQGKTTMTLQIALAVAAGKAIFNLKTIQGSTLFVTAEDSLLTVQRRLRAAAKEAGIDPAKVPMWIHDIRESPTLFGPSSEGGGCETTDAYDELVKVCMAIRPSLIVIDNISICYAGPSADKNAVHRFVQHMNDLVRPWGGAVVLLGHISKSENNTSTYADSVAWNNSVRSRLFLNQLTLEHKKCNLDKKMPKMRFTLLETGVLRRIDPPTDDEQAMSSHYKLVLQGINQLYQQGLWVSPSKTATNNASKRLLDLPAIKGSHMHSEVIREVVDKLLNLRLLGIEEYKSPNGKTSKRLVVTENGQGRLHGEHESAA